MGALLAAALLAGAAAAEASIPPPQRWPSLLEEPAGGLQPPTLEDLAAELAPPATSPAPAAAEASAGRPFRLFEGLHLVDRPAAAEAGSFRLFGDVAGELQLLDLVPWPAAGQRFGLSEGLRPARPESASSSSGLRLLAVVAGELPAVGEPPRRHHLLPQLETRLGGSSFLGWTQRQGNKGFNLGIVVGEGVGPNLYQYGLNDPINRSDPLGLAETFAMGPEERKAFLEAYAQQQQKLAAMSPEEREAYLTAQRQESAESASLALGATPVVGDVKDWQEVLTGRDYVTGERLGLGERGLTALGGGLPFIPGKWVREGWGWLSRLLRRSDDVPLRVPRGQTTVIGKVKDLGNLGPGENTLLKHLPNQGSPKANWAQNSGVLRREMAKGRPIRDASVDPVTGELIDYPGSFLDAERNLLRDRGWTYEPVTNLWSPP